MARPSHPAGNDALLHPFITLARGELQRHFRPDCCIAATRITCTVLGHYGLLVRPLPVTVAVYNAAFCARLERGEPYPTDPAATLRWAAEDGAWAVGIGLGGGAPGYWPGHLVALVGPDPPRAGGPPPWLLDLSLPQADRPTHGIRLAPLLAPAPTAFLAGRERLVQSINDCLVSYEVTPGNVGFALTPDWLDRTHGDGVVTRLRQQLDRPLPHGQRSSRKDPPHAHRQVH